MHLFEFIDSREQAKRSPERSPNVAGSKRPVERLRAAGEKSLTVNFGICFKPTLRLRDGDESRTPRHYACPIRFRVGWLMEGKDVWWKIRDESSSRAALDDILTVAQL